MLPRVDGGLLRWVIAAEGIAFAAGVLMVMGHGVWAHLSTLRRRSRLVAARTSLQSALDGGGLPDAEVGQMADLGLDLQVRLFGDVATNLTGVARPRVLAVATDAGVLAAAEGSCGSRKWWRRLQGARLFTILGGGEAVMPALFTDDRVELRAQAAEWAVDHPTADVLDRLVAMLADPEAASRFTAQDTLLRLGPLARDAVFRCLQAAEGPGLEPALAVAAGLGDDAFLEPALQLCGHTSPRIRALSARPPGMLGGGGAVERLVGMLEDPEEEVVAAAARALGKLKHWPLAGALAGLLGDPAWSVRHQAGLALRCLGAPGMLFLRRSLSDPDPFVADMARHVLDLPDSAAQALAS